MADCPPQLTELTRRDVVEWLNISAIRLRDLNGLRRIGNAFEFAVSDWIEFESLKGLLPDGDEGVFGSISQRNTFIEAFCG